MWIIIVSLPFFIIFSIFTLLKVRQDYKRLKKLSRISVIVVWILYVAHALLTIYAAWCSYLTLPINEIVSISIGSIFIILGSGFYIAGLIAFRSFKRMSGLNANKLITSGIYRCSRNPQNVGWSIFLFGIALIGKSFMAIILVVGFLIILHLYIIYIEEEYLEEIFGEEFRKYRSITPRYLGWPKKDLN